MNSTLLTLISNTSTINIESWFIPFDILMILFNTLTVGLALICLLIILIDETCHTIPMMLTANSCLAELIIAGDTLSIAIFILHNDLKQIQYQDLFCMFRGYLTYVACTILNYSLLLQAFYRYMTVVYPTRLFYQSSRFQLFVIFITWLIAFLYPIGFLFGGNIIYNVDNQMCQVPLRFSFPMIFMTLYIYIIPVSLTVLIYLKLVQYVKEMSQRVTLTNTLFRARRELRMVRRIVILVTILIGICFVYAVFIFISFFTDPPKYHFRIAYIIGNLSLLLLMIMLFQFTKPILMCLKKMIRRRSTRVIPTMTFVNRKNNI